MGSLGGMSVVKRQGRETTRETRTPRQSRLRGSTSSGRFSHRIHDSRNTAFDCEKH